MQTTATPPPLADPVLASRHRFPALNADFAHGVGVFADNSSRAQMPDLALAAVQEQLLWNETHRGGQPAWDSPRAGAMAALRQRAREVAAEFCGATPAQIGFAANGTATLAVMARALFPAVLRPGDTIVVTEADHEANRAPWKALARLGCRIVDVPVGADGSVRRQEWIAALARRPRLVALCMISNVTGVVLPYAQLAREAHAVGSVVALDAVQGPPHGHLEAMTEDVDLAVFSNCKLFAPHLGWWAVREELVGRMELSPPTACHPELEWGTMPHAAFAGFVATHEYLRGLSPEGTLAGAMAAVRRHEQALAQRFLANLPAGLRGELLAAETPYPRVPIFSIAAPRRRWAALREAFAQARIDARIGQFGCPATLARLAAHADATALRVSFVHYNTAADVDAVCETLHRLEARPS